MLVTANGGHASYWRLVPLEKVEIQGHNIVKEPVEGEATKDKEIVAKDGRRVALARNWRLSNGWIRHNLGPEPRSLKQGLGFRV